jgi:hypothetical protein
MRFRAFVQLPTLALTTAFLLTAAYSQPATGCLAALGKSLIACSNKPENEQSACQAAAEDNYLQCKKSSSGGTTITSAKQCYANETTADRACAKESNVGGEQSPQAVCFKQAQAALQRCLMGD